MSDAFDSKKDPSKFILLMLLREYPEYGKLLRKINLPDYALEDQSRLSQSNQILEIMRLEGTQMPKAANVPKIEGKETKRC